MSTLLYSPKKLPKILYSIWNLISYISGSPAPTLIFTRDQRSPIIGADSNRQATRLVAALLLVERTLQLQTYTRRSVARAAYFRTGPIQIHQQRKLFSLL